MFFASNETDAEFDLETESLMRLVTEFKSTTPLVGLKVRDDLYGLGAETVLTLASGFPTAIYLQCGYAESIGAIYSAAEVLRRSACDTILLFGGVDQNGSPEIPDWIRGELDRSTVIQFAAQPDAFADLFVPCPVVQAGQPFTDKVLRGDGVMLSCTDPEARDSAESIL